MKLRPDSGRSDTGQSSRTVQSGAVLKATKLLSVRGMSTALFRVSSELGEYQLHEVVVN